MCLLSNLPKNVIKNIITHHEIYIGSNRGSIEPLNKSIFSAAWHVLRPKRGENNIVNIKNIIKKEIRDDNKIKYKIAWQHTVKYFFYLIE